MPSRGMGAINPSKMPKGKMKQRRDNTDFEQFKEGGSVNHGALLHWNGRRTLGKNFNARSRSNRST